MKWTEVVVRGDLCAAGATMCADHSSSCGICLAGRKVPGCSLQVEVDVDVADLGSSDFDFSAQEPGSGHADNEMVQDGVVLAKGPSVGECR